MGVLPCVRGQRRAVADNGSGCDASGQSMRKEERGRDEVGFVALPGSSSLFSLQGGRRAFGGEKMMGMRRGWNVAYHGRRGGLMERRRGMWKMLSFSVESSGQASRSGASPKQAFRVEADMHPTADQPQAIASLVSTLENHRFAMLKGATGTGKTFVMGHVISELKKPALILSHNKTLAAQLARELRGFLPHNAVELFISYYDSFTPEAYNPKSGTYITKLAVINKEIDALRHRATKALVERPDVVIVASISCIYGLGLPMEYLEAVRNFSVGQSVSFGEIETELQDLMYEKVQALADLGRGCFHVSGNNTISLWPPYVSMPIQLVFNDGEISRIQLASYMLVDEDKMLSFPEADRIDEGDLFKDGHTQQLSVFPARHYVTPEERRVKALARIRTELDTRLEELTMMGQIEEAERLREKTTTDIKMIEELGFCSGVENYSRHLGLRDEGEPPDTLMAFYDHAFGKDGWILIVDESHVALPQLKAMYHGDRRRKETLVQHGFRLPSALDNRPLHEDEFWEKVGRAMFVSATPSKKELQLAGKNVTEMVIRPTGVMDPQVTVRGTETQLEDLVELLQERARREERSLVMTVTKRDAEDLADFLASRNVRCSYLHSGLKTVQRSEVIAQLQRAEIDCIVGVNLLREGIDLPQVSLVCVMDADKQGFLRSKSSLLQMIGRAARHVNGEAIMFAGGTSPAMEQCIMETNLRRKKQEAYLKKHALVPVSAQGREIASLFEIEKENADIDNSSPDQVDGMDWETITQLLEAKREVRRQNKETQGDASAAPMATQPKTPSHMQDLRAQAKELPTKTGVYLWKTSDENEEAEVLYIGKAKNLKSRVSSYLRQGAITTRGTRLAAMLVRAREIEVIITPGGERDALLLESDLIKKYRPLYNVLLRDSRFYPYIVITPHTEKDLPKLMTSVRPDLENARYFGPFTSSAQLRRIMELMEGALKLRQLRFQIKFGSGDDVKAEEALKSKYLHGISLATRVLEGDGMKVAEELVRSGDDQAGRLLLSMVDDEKNEDGELERAWNRVADNARAARDVMTMLELESVPRRIEAFDVSHFYGENTVASNVVFLDGEPARHLFRSYKLEQVNDDFASIQKAVKRRLKSKDLPDLIVIDGGKGQLSAALSAMADAGVSRDEVRICALAKQNEELFVPGRLHAIPASPDSKAMLFLRNVRDESHRHAISKMRSARNWQYKNGKGRPSKTVSQGVYRELPVNDSSIGNLQKTNEFAALVGDEFQPEASIHS